MGHGLNKVGFSVHDFQDPGTLDPVLVMEFLSSFVSWVIKNNSCAKVSKNRHSCKIGLKLNEPISTENWLDICAFAAEHWAGDVTLM